MDKRLVLPQNVESRRDVFFVREDRTYLRKHASSYHPEIASYIEKAKPLANLVQVLLTALGSYEFWGQNVNGDRFREGALKHEGDDYGYKTFETNANYFTHHVNKDPSLAKGRILKSVWNDKAKRVELVVGIDINLDPEGAAMIDRGEDLTFSMGAKVPFDVCSICQKRAKTRNEYCDHLRYLMNQIDPISNLLVGADNTLPRFFDMSRVLIPADKTAHMWTKIASAANPYQQLGSAYLATLPPGKLNDVTYLMGKVAEQRETYSKKLADVKKKATISKRVEVKTTPAFAQKMEYTIPAAKAMLQADSPSLSAVDIEKIRATHATLPQVLSTFLALGMIPKEGEIVELYPEGHSHKITKEAVAFYPKVAEVLEPYVSERSFSRPVLVSRILKLAQRLEEGNVEITKKAEEIRTLMRRESPKDSHALFMAGLLAAAYALFSKQVGPVLGGLGSIFTKYPYLAYPLSAAMISGARTLSGPADSGFSSVDANTEGLYNKNWQSRFAEMQARPVTVIKTGAAQADTELARKFFYGVPSLFLLSKTGSVRSDLLESQAEQRPGAISQFITENPEIVSEGLLGEALSGRSFQERVSGALESGKRVIKTASIRDLEFLETVPRNDQKLFYDLAILDAADRICKKVSGG